VPETCAADPDSEASKAAAPLSPRNDEWRREQIAGLRILLVEDNKYVVYFVGTSGLRGVTETRDWFRGMNDEHALACDADSISGSWRSS
jgi:hypothetical protein